MTAGTMPTPLVRVEASITEWDLRDKWPTMLA
jgi:hypothetical protein